ncbi:MAG: metallopeptidase family protein [Opitutales bacterium]
MRHGSLNLGKIAEAEIVRLSGKLPPEVRAALEEIPVHLQARPEAEVAKACGDDLLGLFSGEAMHERGETLLPAPPQIHLYLSNIWDEARQDPVAFREEVRITLLHELGHYLGWNEEDMERYGIE